MARQKRSRRSEPPQAMALILCVRFFLSKPQTLRWFAVWSPGDSEFPLDPRRNQSLRSEALRSKTSYSGALFLLLRCRPQAGSASQKPLRFSWIFPARIDRPMQIRTAQQFLLAVRIFCTYETATAVRFDSDMTGGA